MHAATKALVVFPENVGVVNEGSTTTGAAPLFNDPFNLDVDGNPINPDVKWSYKSSNDFEWFNTIIEDIFLIKKDERTILDAG